MSTRLKAVFEKLRSRRRSEASKARMEAVAVACVNDAVELEAQVYGITTGVGGMDIDVAPLSLPITPSGSFDFQPPSGSPTWPGPRYEEIMQLDPSIFNRSRDMMLPKTKLKQKRAMAKRSTSHEDRSAVQKLNAKATKPASKCAKKKRASANKKPQFCKPPPARDEPLHLLSLPGEIRNQIYRYLYVSKEPLYAKYRPIMPPHRGGASHETRRFPREPALALVCKQLRSEATSLFYAENTFVFASAAGSLGSQCRPMTTKPWLSKWMEASTFTTALSRVELRIGDKYSPSASAKEAVTYVFKRTADTALEISVEPNPERCACFDEKFLDDNLQEFLAHDPTGNLIEAVMRLHAKRAGAAVAELRQRVARAQQVQCKDCGKSTWSLVERA